MLLPGKIKKQKVMLYVKMIFGLLMMETQVGAQLIGSLLMYAISGPNNPPHGVRFDFVDM